MRNSKRRPPKDFILGVLPDVHAKGIVVDRRKGRPTPFLDENFPRRLYGGLSVRHGRKMRYEMKRRDKWCGWETRGCDEGQRGAESQREREREKEGELLPVHTSKKRT